MQTMIRLAILALACASLPLAAAERTDQRAVSGFDSVSLAAPIKLAIVQADTEGLVLEGEAEDLAEIETVVENGTLKIRPRKRMGWSMFQAKLRGTLNAKNVRGLEISGSGDISAASLRGEALAVSVSGAGDVHVGSAAYPKVNVSISGSGDVTVGGKTESVRAQIAGSGDVRAGSLEAREAKVSIAGSGDATVWAREKLDVSIAGSGDVKYFGEPAVQKSVVGSGSVRRAKGSPS